MRILVTCVVLVLTFVLAAPASAQTYPSTPSAEELFSTTPHFVDPELQNYFASGYTTGAYGPFLTKGVTFDGGIRHDTDSSVWFHGALGGGESGFFGEPGTYMHASAGLELRGCSDGGGICAFAGADVGLMHADDSMDSVDALVLIPRLGLEVGTRRVRLRGSLDAPINLAASSDGGLGGFFASVGLVVSL